MLNCFYMICSANDDTIVIRRIVAVDALSLKILLPELTPAKPNVRTGVATCQYLHQPSRECSTREREVTCI
jgi:hypothetical protein